MNEQRVVAVIQARMGSTRLPGKVLADIEGRPLLAWTVDGVSAIRGVAAVVVATTTEAADDALVGLAEELGVGIHRGSVVDVLRRCRDAVARYNPDVVIRQTADNPFPDPAVAESQVRLLTEEEFDYVGISGWPLGISAEVCRFAALESADREATDPADREHVMPFLYRQPDRFRIGASRRSGAGRPVAADARYTVDTEADLAFARALASRLGHGPPVTLGELEAILENQPDLLGINAAVAQKPWHETQYASEGRPWTS